MNTRRSLLRGVTSLALAAAIIGVGAPASIVSAAPLNKPSVEKPNIPGEIPGLGSFGNGQAPQIPQLGNFGNGQIPEIPGIGNIGNGAIPGIPGIGDIGSHGSDIGDVPIIGDIANTFKDAEPEEIATGVIQMAGAAAEFAVPIIVDLATK